MDTTEVREIAQVQDRIEGFVRKQFRVADGDTRFSAIADLYENGYVDSVGVVELLAFIGEEFGVDVPERDLLSPEFSSVAGIAGIVGGLM